MFEVLAQIAQFFISLRSGFNALVDSYGLLMRLIIAVVTAVVTILLVKLVISLFLKLHGKVAEVGAAKIKPLKIKNYRILDSRQIVGVILWAVTALRYEAVVLMAYLGITGILGLFAPTRTVASKLLGYIWTPLYGVIIGVINFIPNLCVIVVTIFVTRYILRLLKILSAQIERGKLVIPGFYQDWASPTYALLRILVIVLTAAVIYPQLPNSGSEAFKGISMFVGLLISLGSSSAISNMVAGFVLTYTRSFKMDDFISLNGITGHVVEKSGLVTRVKTTKNEYVTFPNTTVLNAAVTNYNTSLELEHGLIIHATVTEGYDTPWRTIHEVLIAAAQKTAGVLENPPPYVNQRALDDFYCKYEVNAYTRDVDKLSRLYSDLYKNIQDEYAARGLDLFSPHYYKEDKDIGANTVTKDTGG
jgi:small-conductance mechanosensitive channel